MIRILMNSETAVVFSAVVSLLCAYVLGGEGDPRALIGGMYFWTWNTEEVLALVEWMRDHNARSEHKIHFTGFESINGFI